MRPDSDTAAPLAADEGPTIAFVHVQKAAGTTLKFILRNSLGVRHLDVNPVDPPYDRPFNRDDLAFARSANPRLCSISSHELIEPTRHLGDLVLPFTVLRDPVRRSVSHYQDKVVRGRRDLGFDDFIDDPANRNFQVRKIAGEEDLQAAMELLRDRYFFVGLAERFPESIRILEALCPYRLDIRCRPQNVAADRAISEALLCDPENLKRLQEANQLDQRLWDYVDRELLPASRRRAGAGGDEPLPRLPVVIPPWRFHASRAYHRLVYRPLLKRERRRRAAQA